MTSFTSLLLLSYRLLLSNHVMTSWHTTGRLRSRRAISPSCSLLPPCLSTVLWPPVSRLVGCGLVVHPTVSRLLVHWLVGVGFVNSLSATSCRLVSHYLLLLTIRTFLRNCSTTDSFMKVCRSLIVVHSYYCSHVAYPLLFIVSTLALSPCTCDMHHSGRWCCLTTDGFSGVDMKPR